MIKKVSQKLNKELEDIGIDMLPQFVENPCPVCGTDDCICEEGCDSCGA